MKRKGKRRLETPQTVAQAQRPYLRDIPVIPGRPLIEGRQEPTFPAFYLVVERPVTFRDPRPGSSREEREEHCLDWIVRARHAKDRILVLIPATIYADGRHGIFLCGWTLFEQAEEVRTHQCVVFFRDDILPIGACDQGVICVADPRRLSAWDGRTEDQSRAQAA